MMIKTLRCASILACICLVSACAGSRTGLVDASLSSSEHPAFTLHVNEPLHLKAHGREWVGMQGDVTGDLATATVHYAVYGDTVADEPLTRHAHTMIVDISNGQRWRFVPENQRRFGGVSWQKIHKDGISWTMQLFPVQAATDWFSVMWQQSGREVPRLWLAHRASATPSDTRRVIAEYREPWPECMEEGTTNLFFVERSCLSGFLARAEAAFTIDRSAALATGAAPLPSILPRPVARFNTRQLIGDVQQQDTNDGVYFGR